MQCPKGTVHINNTCQLCPPGSYQDEIAQITCKPCPEQTFTQFPGSQTFNACLRMLLIYFGYNKFFKCLI